MDITKSQKKLLAAFLLCLSSPALSEDGPWFTGPLLAPSGHTIPAGHSNLEVYGFYTKNEGIYKRHAKIIHTPGNHNTVINPLFSHGLNDFMDIQYSFPMTHNVNQGKQGGGVSDISALLGFQLLEQNDQALRPDLRITLHEVFPSGRYERLNPGNKGTDATGLGSYRTSITLNFQHLQQLFESHYLRTRLSLDYTHFSAVKINGISSYGGTIDSSGNIKPGHHISIDIAGEFTLSQHWVAVMEAFASKRASTLFRGFPGTTVSGMPAMIGNTGFSDVSLAPAIEYNFNGNLGIIGGAWFSLPDNNSVKFVSSVIAVNAYW